ncbi:MAG: 50S ribosomal protein L17 [Kiritimatiellales bacterium]|nr:50S ribosomal protein L17 [Kiritimatiellales bacterium]
MRHQNKRLGLIQKPAHARMLKRNLVTSLLLYESVRTTKNRAKAIKPIVDRLITVAKTRPEHIAIRFINRTVTDKNASRKIMEIYKARYSDRSGGLTRMVPVGARKGDGAELVDLSLVEGIESSDDRNELRVTRDENSSKST